MTISHQSLNKSFFELGGTSLQAIQLATCLNDYNNVQLSLSDMYNYTNLNELYDHVKNYLKVTTHHNSDISLIKPTIGELYPLSWRQEEIYILEKLSNKSSNYIMPLIFSIKGDLHLPSLQKAFE